MSDIVEFLRARLDEDEREARVCLARWAEGGGTTRRRWDRQLREVEAKRAILAALADAEQAVSGYDNGNPDNPPSYWQEWGNRHALALTVEHLAAVYADHPDYRQEWL